MPTLLETKQEELAAKRKSAYALIEAKPDYNWTEAEVESFQTQQKELDALTTEVKRLSGIDQQAQALRAALDADDRPAPMQFGDGTKAAPVRRPTAVAGDNPINEQDLGNLFVNSAAFKNWRGGDNQTVAAEIADYTVGYKTTMDTATGYAPQSVRIGKVVDYALRRTVVADLLPQGTTTMPAIVYMEETTFTNGAAAVAEGGTKPEGTLAFTEQTAPVRKIAVTLPVTDELFADVPAMRAYVNARLGRMIELKEEDYLLTGTGTAPQIKGILNYSNIQNQPRGTDPVPDAVFKAMTLIQTVAFSEATGVIFHPTNWQNVRLLRTADGIYIWGNPSDPGPQRIWGLPVVSTTAMTLNTALVGDFAMGAQIFRRQGLTLETTNSHDQDFTKNQLRIRAEERLALAVYRPTAFCTVTSVL